MDEKDLDFLVQNFFDGLNEAEGLGQARVRLSHRNVKHLYFLVAII